MATTPKTPAAKKKASTKTPSTARTRKAAVIEAGNGEANIYTMAGATAGTIALPAELFGLKWNADLVHQVVVGMQANARPTVAHTKFRGEVSGGGKKPWKQKGTGRARHGSTRSPIWRHGGITHGPRAERNYSVKINRKMRAAALATILSRKYRDGEIIFVDKISFAAPSTKEARAAVVAIAKASGQEQFATKRVNAAVVAFAKKDVTAEKSLRNIGSLTLEEVRNLNPVDLVTKKYLIIENPTDSLAQLAARLTK
jgi:large subunit ribosomal protein L4